MTHHPPRWLQVATACLAACLSLGATVRAAERITNFDCRVVVEDEGVISVTETISVVAEGDQIKRGIFRDIPVRYGNGLLGLGTNIPFTITAIECDGKPANYRMENRDATVRIYVGDDDQLLSHGTHTYVISYQTRQLRFFSDHDEVYWNATGNAWAFPIEQATASVVLPAAAEEDAIVAEAYLGPLDSTNQAGVAIGHLGSGPGRTFAAQQQLPPGDGLTIVVQFPKGLVAPVSGLQRVLDDPYFIAGFFGLAVVIAYFSAAWWLVGRDPATGVVFPLFDPPDGMSPAACRFVSRMGFDKNCFSVALLSLGSQGCLAIHEDNKTYTLSKTGPLPETASDGEKKVYSELLGSRSSISVKQTHHATFSKAIYDLRKSLIREFEGTLFRPNRVWFFSGVAITVAALFTTVFQGGGLEASMVGGFLTLWLSFWSVVVVGLIHSVLASWRSVFTSETAVERGISVGKSMFATVFTIPFVAGELVGMYMLALKTSIWMLPILLGMVATVVVFYELIKAPTVAGRGVMDRIDGFRMYLATAEKDRLEAVTQQAFAGPTSAAHPRSLELFERYLPYAVALDVANAWAAQFQDLIDAASAAEGRQGSGGYHPVWYQGSGWTPASVGTAAAGLGSAMTAAVAAAATSPSSGSGGGGGGSSGGGGGGGGGGGW